MLVHTRIKKDIPRLIARFPKLRSGKPYRFQAWSKGKGGAESLVYAFDGTRKNVRHIKRIPLREMVLAVQLYKRKRLFDRSDYNKACPGAAKSGPCGFAVIGRYLEFRHKAHYQGRGKGFV